MKQTEIEHECSTFRIPSRRLKIGAVLTTGTIALLSALGSVGGAQTLVIDDFSSPGPSSQFLGAFGGSPDSALFASPGALGGFREVNLMNNFPVTTNRVAWLFSASPSPSLLTGNPLAGLLSSDTGGRAEWSITYDGNGSGLGVDLSSFSSFVLSWEGDQDEFEFDTSMTITLTDSQSRSASSTVLWQAGQMLPSRALDTSWALSDFSAAGTGIDLSDIDSIRWSGVGDESMDASFSSLRAIPEPSSLLLIGIGAGAFVFSSRRRARPMDT